ncbi:hypothetical protein RHMOL_Rhmol01G0288500 [Rhododendron molle]|uniref:Uncharacterized protein n=1 Tax=Rhododendron molle TaxID=49168 RepID=A0ACC0Q8I2_RHOML|nr:hypothetical protein RHMOL_Rhmol01G0288500 [Rhododendron molle]
MTLSFSWSAIFLSLCAGSTLMKFGYTCVTTIFNGEEFIRRLYPIVQKLNLDQVIIKLGNRMWTIPRNNIPMSYPIFREFIEELPQKWTDFILVAVLRNYDIRVVIDGIQNWEKNYEWV